MLASQRLLLEQSQTRQRIAAALENTELTTEERSAMDADTQRMSQIEVELRGALVVEGEPTETPSEDGEGREIRELEQRAQLSRYFEEIAQDITITGAEAELRSAVFGDSSVPRGMVPLQMLLSDDELAAWHNRNVETRAVTPVAAAARTQGNQNSIAARVFARSVPGYLGIMMPTVPLGTTGYPVMTGGTTFSQQSIGGSQAAVAGTFDGDELSPIRATASYEYSVEDMYRLAGLEEALRADLREGLSDLMSTQVLNGNGTAPNVQGIRTAITATPGTDPANADDFSEITQRFAGLVDGINAFSMSDLRILMSTGTYTHAIAQYRGNQSTMSALDWLMEKSGGVEVSSRFPAPATDIAHSVVHLTSYPERDAVAPVWAGVQFIDDPYSMAQSGQKRLTALMLWNFRVLISAAWKHIKVHD